MNKTTVSNLMDKDNNHVGILVKTGKGKTFTVPVVDVRVSEDKRRIANAMIKDGNRARGSQYINNRLSRYI